MVRAAASALVLMASLSSGYAQTAKPKSPHEIAEASRLLAEKREACRQEAKTQKLSAYQRHKYRLACLKK